MTQTDPKDRACTCAGCESHNIVRIRHDVGEETARKIEALVADEPLLSDRDRTPVHLDDYVVLLAADAPVIHVSAELRYCFSGGSAYEHDVKLISSDTPEGDHLLASLAANHAMPQPLLALGFGAVTDFWAPWCIALHEADIASIGMTARNGKAGVEAGVVTVPELRRLGFATAATAGWASHPSLQDRTLFYTTERTNVAARLGLRFIGAGFRLT